MTDREQAILRRVLTGLLVAAVLVASVVAGVTVHPLVGAALALVAFGAWWTVLTGRQHAADTAVRQAEVSAAGRRPLDASAFESPARPSVPGQPVPPWAGAS